ncbi:type VII secretion system-associated protein [Streptomyces cadmiisoli]|uniref:Type VII secretion system-associated protein n=1 Tax=Streptomyces cadmiisoli TaxID=2184053 RepID=A0A2Z4JCW4_9ACTN|nr:hypothetical protein DN051_03485 [Streptomyces cadmiisoli]
MRPGERQEDRHGALSAASGTSLPTVGHEAPASDTTEAADAPETPDIPEAVRAAARRAPGHWIGMVDPEWTDEGTPPEWAVLGEWQSDDSGDVGEFRGNPAYRPSARVLGWPEPSDPVDAAAQRAATGYGSVDEALAALAEAEITVVRGPHGGPLTAAGRDGAPVVLLFTSPAHEFMSSTLHHDTLPAQELARSLSGPGSMLLVNAAAAAPLLVPADRLLGGAGGVSDDAALAADTTATGTSTPTETTGTSILTAATADTPTGATDTGAPAPASSADRTDSSAQPWTHSTGRTS